MQHIEETLWPAGKELVEEYNPRIEGYKFLSFQIR
jgi:hypothetical protein